MGGLRFFTVLVLGPPPPRPPRSTGGLPGPNWCTWCCDCGAPIVVHLRSNEPTLSILCAPCDRD